MAHSLQTLSLELDYADEAQAWSQQAALQRFAAERVPALLAAVLDEFDEPDQVWQLERLQLQLGELPADPADPRWDRGLQQALRDALAALRLDGAGSDAGAQAATRPPPEHPANRWTSRGQRQLALLQDWLQRGELAALSGAERRAMAPAELLQALLAGADAAELLRWLRDAPAAAWQRLAVACPPALQHRLAQAWADDARRRGAEAAPTAAEPPRAAARRSPAAARRPPWTPAWAGDAVTDRHRRASSQALAGAPTAASSAASSAAPTAASSAAFDSAAAVASSGVSAPALGGRPGDPPPAAEPTSPADWQPALRRLYGGRIAGLLPAWQRHLAALPAAQRPAAGLLELARALGLQALQLAQRLAAQGLRPDWQAALQSLVAAEAAAGSPLPPRALAGSPVLSRGIRPLARGIAPLPVTGLGGAMPEAGTDPVASAASDAASDANSDANSAANSAATSAASAASAASATAAPIDRAMAATAAASAGASRSRPGSAGWLREARERPLALAQTERAALRSEGLGGRPAAEQAQVLALLIAAHESPPVEADERAADVDADADADRRPESAFDAWWRRLRPWAWERPQAVADALRALLDPFPTRSARRRPAAANPRAGASPPPRGTGLPRPLQRLKRPGPSRRERRSGAAPRDEPSSAAAARSAAAAMRSGRAPVGAAARPAVAAPPVRRRHAAAPSPAQSMPQPQPLPLPRAASAMRRLVRLHPSADRLPGATAAGASALRTPRTEPPTATRQRLLQLLRRLGSLRHARRLLAPRPDAARGRRRERGRLVPGRRSRADARRSFAPAAMRPGSADAGGASAAPGHAQHTGAGSAVTPTATRSAGGAVDATPRRVAQAASAAVRGGLAARSAGDRPRRHRTALHRQGVHALHRVQDAWRQRLRRDLLARWAALQDTPSGPHDVALLLRGLALLLPGAQQATLQAALQWAAAAQRAGLPLPAPRLQVLPLLLLLRGPPPPAPRHGAAGLAPSPASLHEAAWSRLAPQLPAPRRSACREALFAALQRADSAPPATAGNAAAIAADASAPAPAADAGVSLRMVGNAGLVLCAHFLPRLWRRLGLLQADAQAFAAPAAAARAAQLLQTLASGSDEAPEHWLALNKLLCGLPLDALLPAPEPVGDAEREALDGLLRALIAHWQALGRTTVPGLRASFLMRQGSLRPRADDGWQLRVQPRSYDLLLDRLPWAFRTIRLPWMKELLHVDWR